MRKQRRSKYWTDRIVGHGEDIYDGYSGYPEELPEMAEYVARVKLPIRKREDCVRYLMVRIQTL